MRLLFALILIASCSHPLKFKYPSNDRSIASIEEVQTVQKIDIEIKNSKIFASGMDSTYVMVRLFDAEGSLLTNIDPDELTISSSEDLEAKPFVFKQGVYKAELLPRLKSKNIHLKVDWLEKVASPEVILETTIAPLKQSLEEVRGEEADAVSFGELSVMKGSSKRDKYTEGFSFENLGHNLIVNSKANSSAQRSFNFVYPEQASQNLALEIEDTTSEDDSQDMNSVLMFFPRINLPLVDQLTGTLVVTLPTGEKVVFKKNSKEIVEGVLAEGPVDFTKEASKRIYPDIDYRGKGIMLRANARGQSPKLGQNETDKIDIEYGISGSVDVLIVNGTTGQRCRRPKEDFWEPLEVSPIEFKFTTDEEFEAYLKSKCGFGIPKI